MFNKMTLLIGLISRLLIAFATFLNLNYQWKVEVERQQKTKGKIEKVVHHLRLERVVDSFNQRKRALWSTNGIDANRQYKHQRICL